jgi:uncharacterized protein YcbK (DUF882 family)
MRSARLSKEVRGAAAPPAGAAPAVQGSTTNGSSWVNRQDAKNAKKTGILAPLAPWRLIHAVALLGLSLLALAPSAAAAEAEHVVARGHTLGKIARRYHTTVDALREVNGLKPGELLRPGQRLIIPERGKEAEATRRAAALRKDTERQKASAGREKGDKADKADKATSRRAKGPADGKPKEKSYARRPKRPGFVHLIRGTEELEIQLLTRSGRLDPKALPKLTRLLRSPAGAIPIDPRLATLIGMVSNHFGGRTIRVVSGYRPYSPTQYTPHSNHNVGRALDFSIPGVPNTVVRDFCRTFRNAGVGYYPNSTFVHLDARSGKVYWVDYSRPGEAPRYNLAARSPVADETVVDVTEATRSTGEDGSPMTLGSDEKEPGNKDQQRKVPDRIPIGGARLGLQEPPPSSTPATPAARARGAPAQP